MIRCTYHFHGPRGHQSHTWAGSFHTRQIMEECMLAELHGCARVWGCHHSQIAYTAHVEEGS